jgi:exodeoxyribonuclease III
MGHSGCKAAIRGTGDVMPETLTVMSWNVENVVPSLRALGRDLQRLGHPQILCLQELRIRPDDRELVALLEAALPDYVCHFSLCSDRKNVTFRGGRAHGVATYAHRSLASRELPHPAWDAEGRVVISELPGIGLAVVNVYAVNGTSRAYFDHELGRVSGDRHAFKRRFNEFLMQHCADLRRDGLDLLLIGDFNVSRAAIDTHPRLRTASPHALARRLFNEVLMPTLDVVDVYRELHPAERKYTWFNRRTPPGKLDAARVDFALLSRSLLGAVRAADILEAPDARAASDHAPFFVELAIPNSTGRETA